MHFSELQINADLLKGLEKNNYEQTTEIQDRAITHLLKSSENFVGVAQTGTGKTAAFLVPIIEKLDLKHSTIQSIILAPTRELAAQIEGELLKLSSFMDLRSLCVYGGTIYDKQIDSLQNKKPHIVVGTPGRVIDLIEKGFLNCSKVSTCVLDEADEMLNMGFYDDVAFILDQLGEKKQLIMFSATMPRNIKKLIHNSFGKHTLVEIEKKTVSNSNIDQKYFIVKNKHFKEALARLIDSTSHIYAIVFCRTKLESREVGDDLVKRGHNAVVLNGDMGQAERDSMMNKFKSKKASILVCTDVAARGIDVSDLTHVFNYGLPQDQESYVHRIGRTGRHNSKGEAMTIIGPNMAFAIKSIEKHTKQKMTYAKLPTINELKATMVRNDIENSKHIIEAVKLKGDSFRTEVGFEEFLETFSDLPREELMKILFTWKFNKSMRRYNNLESIEDVAAKGNSNKEFKPQKKRNFKKRR